MGCRFIPAALTLAALIVPACGGDAPRRLPGTGSPVSRAQEERQRADRALSKLEHERLNWPDDRARFADAAARAWRFIDRQYQPATGLIKSLEEYPYATTWDIGSMIGAFYSAHGLGLLGDAAYYARMNRLLTTLGEVRLARNRVFNKSYDTRSGAMPGSDRVRGRQGIGWSTTDLGRLLVWLRIVGADPHLAEKAAAAVKRNDFGSLVKAGYLWGTDLDRHGQLQTYPEGHLGYEQYAARGFALWGFHADKALSLTENGLPVSIMGQSLLADFRRWDKLTNEPFVLWGLELGWDGGAATLARRLLKAQEERFRRTGRMTITGEDAMVEPPHYFYYYCVFANGRAFAVDTQDRTAFVEGPRWVSAKTALAYHALMPTRYTDAAVRAVDAARSANAWASGVYEGTSKPTASANINTAGIILEAALYQRRGEPLLWQATHAPGRE